MSFKLLDRMDSLLTHAANEIKDAMELEVDTEEYKLKQRLVAALGDRVTKLSQSVDTLTEEWEVNMENPPAGFEDYENYRDWEQSNSLNIEEKVELRSTPRRQQTVSRFRDHKMTSNPMQLLELDPENRVGRVIKGIEDATISFYVLLDGRLRASERVSKSLLDQGMAELLLRVVNVSPRRVNDFLRDKGLDETSFAAILERFTTAEGKANKISMFCEMEKAFIRVDASTRITAFIQSIIGIIAQLKFAVWWNTHTGNGTAGWKSDHQKKLTTGMTDAQAKSAIKAFRVSRDFRNISLRLYQTFGANVVLQPIFQVHSGGKSSMKNNTPVLNKLVARYHDLMLRSSLLLAIHEMNPEFEGDEDEMIEAHLLASHNAAVEFILILLHKAGGDPLKTWAKEFFDEFDEHKEIRVVCRSIKTNEHHHSSSMMPNKSTHPTTGKDSTRKAVHDANKSSSTQITQSGLAGSSTTTSSLGISFSDPSVPQASNGTTTHVSRAKAIKPYARMSTGGKAPPRRPRQPRAPLAVGLEVDCGIGHPEVTCHAGMRLPGLATENTSYAALPPTTLVALSKTFLGLKSSPSPSPRPPTLLQNPTRLKPRSPDSLARVPNARALPSPTLARHACIPAPTSPTIDDASTKLSRTDLSNGDFKHASPSSDHKSPNPQAPISSPRSRVFVWSARHFRHPAHTVPPLARYSTPLFASASPYDNVPSPSVTLIMGDWNPGSRLRGMRNPEMQRARRFRTPVPAAMTSSTRTNEHRSSSFRRSVALGYPHDAGLGVSGSRLEGHRTPKMQPARVFENLRARCMRRELTSRHSEKEGPARRQHSKQSRRPSSSSPIASPHHGPTVRRDNRAPTEAYSLLTAFRSMPTPSSTTPLDLRFPLLCPRPPNNPCDSPHASLLTPSPPIPTRTVDVAFDLRHRSSRVPNPRVVYTTPIIPELRSPPRDATRPTSYNTPRRRTRSLPHTPSTISNPRTGSNPSLAVSSTHSPTSTSSTSPSTPEISGSDVRALGNRTFVLARRTRQRRVSLALRWSYGLGRTLGYRWNGHGVSVGMESEGTRRWKAGDAKEKESVGEDGCWRGRRICEEGKMGWKRDGRGDDATEEARRGIRPSGSRTAGDTTDWKRDDVDDGG
ncbi:hypothetical protein FA13DRAFT_1718576 [Coprinellus micaceus]|uniref:Uncharacterized protein n=1 Tax=Coprinellus micaceus TaxID=71717 RepID=A0A4Y7SDY9_COPMI|nr:hypothetical protein FA13DRAFT_1718576 [Coprinellus micaceus]